MNQNKNNFITQPDGNLYLQHPQFINKKPFDNFKRRLKFKKSGSLHKKIQYDQTRNNMFHSRYGRTQYSMQNQPQNYLTQYNIQHHPQNNQTPYNAQHHLQNQYGTQHNAQPHLQNQYGIQPHLQNQYGIRHNAQPHLQNQYGIQHNAQPHLQNQYGIQHNAQPHLQNQYGMQHNAQPHPQNQYGMQHIQSNQQHNSRYGKMQNKESDMYGLYTEELTNKTYANPQYNNIQHEMNPNEQYNRMGYRKKMENEMIQQRLESNPRIESNHINNQIRQQMAQQRRVLNQYNRQLIDDRFGYLHNQNRNKVKSNIMMF
jgi:hypothetical protein